MPFSNKLTKPISLFFSDSVMDRHSSGWVRHQESKPACKVIRERNEMSTANSKSRAAGLQQARKQGGDAADSDAAAVLHQPDK